VIASPTVRYNCFDEFALLSATSSSQASIVVLCARTAPPSVDAVRADMVSLHCVYVHECACDCVNSDVATSQRLSTRGRSTATRAIGLPCRRCVLQLSLLCRCVIFPHTRHVMHRCLVAVAISYARDSCQSCRLHGDRARRCGVRQL
jgi:hypothetical protein